MRSVLAGSLGLIVLYVFSQSATADKVGSGSGVLVNLVKRALSPTVPGLPDKRKTLKLPWSGETESAPKVYSTIYHA